MIKKMGLFRELPYGDPQGPSLADSVSKGDPSIQGLAVDYLESGSLVAISGADAVDVLADYRVVAGRIGLMTDGVWGWSPDLVYYVGK